MTSAAELLRAHLRQRRELGDTELVLQGITPDELLRLLRRAAEAGTARTAGAGSAQPGGAESSIVPVEPANTRPPVERSSPPINEPQERSTVPPPPPKSRPASPGLTAPAIIQLGDLAELRATAMGCPRCALAATRRQVVFGEGNEQARVMVVGEAPGAEEDRTGRPFVGRAGKLLDLLLASVGFPRETVYICNVLKCRPPGNRDPQPEEIEACSPFLRKQVELVAPEAILTVGTFPTQTLLGSHAPIRELRGRVHSFQGTPLIPTYHPAAVLRNPGWIRPVWEDLQRLRVLLDGEAARA